LDHGEDVGNAAIGTVIIIGVASARGCGNNEKHSSTFDLTVWPLSGAVPAGLLLNSDGGAKVKTSRNLEKKKLFFIVILCP
jgi:hypothetical protein